MEMLVTAMLVTVLVSAVMGWNNSWRSQQILAASLRINQDLQLARTLAIKRGYPVELRFYRSQDHTLTTSTPQFKTWQIVGYDSIEKRLIRLTELNRFDSTVILSDSPLYSTIVRMERPLDPTRDPQPSLLPTRFTSIEFRPDGSTSLDPDPGEQWTMTLLTDGYADTRNVLPADARTLIISAENGAVTRY
jgi:uncharacterized protein (TIGR02596 family)